MIGLFFSCTTDTDPAPVTSITVEVPTSAPTTAKAGDKLEFAVKVTAPATLSKFEVSKGTIILTNLTSFLASNYSHNFSYTVTAQDAGQTLTFRFLAEDIKGNSKSSTYSVIIAGTVTPTTDIRLLSQNAIALVGNAVGSFYVSAENKITNSADADVSKVDITYGMVNGVSSFVSPDARVANGLAVGDRTGWTRTTFAASSLSFDALTANELNNATFSGAVVQNVVVGGTYIFQNAANKRGLIRVKSFVANGTGQDVIFDLKIIK